MARHPLHPPTTHAPIGILASSVVFDVLALSTDAPTYWAVAFHVTWLGLVAAVPTVVTGLLELRRLAGASPHEARAFRHGVVMTIALGSYAVSAIVRAGIAPPVGIARIAAVGAELVGLVTLLVGGFLGGDMVYTHGVATSAEARPEGSKSAPSHDSRPRVGERSERLDPSP